jgi:damage-control phosphatase, subfamily I
MKASLECLECVVRQALRTARMAGDDPEMHRQVVNAAVADIPGMDLNSSPAVLSLNLYHYAQQLSGVADPYREIKYQQNAMALELEAELEELVAKSNAPLVTAIKLAASGNIIDLGILQVHEIDPRDAIARAMETPMALDHTEHFLESLHECNDLLYLLDNAGEIVFDKVLIRQLQQYTRVTAVVKAGPIINDACQEDAEQVGLPALCDVIDNGGAFVGSPLTLVPESFLQRMDQSDIILGKGQGNYETVDDFDGNVYLLLKAKCDIVAAHMGIDLGELAFISTKLRKNLN